MIPRPVGIHALPGRHLLSPEARASWKLHGPAAIAETRLVEDPELGAEGYELHVGPEAVRIDAQTPAGLFYAGQTLIQLIDDSGGIPCSQIRDHPRFAWRGMHLDVARHFFPVEFVKRYLDLLALHKLNVFHWHLTDDQGWRIEIRRCPRLTAVGAWRVNRAGIPWNEREAARPDETADYGGFYTRDEIAEVVAYAGERHIEVVPEIEMPAHALAALAAYPELSCAGGPFAVATGQYWPETDLMCPGKEATFTFLANVLAEVAELFPGKFIHIGGDEADTREWARCPDCRRRMADEGVQDAAALQGYFHRRVAQILRQFGKRPVGWDELLMHDPDPDTVIMSWRGTDGGVTAARREHDVVMSPSSHLYFDHYQADPAKEPPAFGGHSPLSRVYAFDPVPDELAPDMSHHVLGAQANLWTEFIPGPQHAGYMALPRMAALAELAWSPREHRDWSDFQRRLPALLAIYDEMGMNYSRHRQ